MTPSHDFAGIAPHLHGLKAIANGSLLSREGAEGQTWAAKTEKEILADIAERTGGMPVLVSDTLYGLRSNGRLAPLRSTADLESWLVDISGLPVRWDKRGESLAAILSALRNSARRMDGFTTRLCWPEPGEHQLYLPSIKPPAKPTGKLDEFLAFFLPATEKDKNLLKALVLTPMWSRAGKRPLFAITANGGAGSGKSRLAGLVAKVYGVTPIAFSIASLEGRGHVTTWEDAFLNDAGFESHIAIADNESGFLSSAALCRHVTNETLQGGAKFRTTAYRPNDITNILTTNGITASHEVARRICLLTIDKPSGNTNGWDARVDAFVAKNREAILGDIYLELAKGPAFEPETDFFPEWTAEVLSHCVESKKELAGLLAAMTADRQALEGVEDDVRRIETELDSMVANVLGDRRDSPHIVHIAHDALKAYFTGHQQTLARLYELVANRQTNRILPIGLKEQFPSYGANRKRGLFFVYGNLTKATYRDDKGVIRIAANADGALEILGTAKSRDIEAWMEGSK